MLDYLLKNARLIDPETGLDRNGSVGIEGGKISWVVPCPVTAPARRELDLEGLALASGFIDVHAHTENDLPCAQRLALQGVTTAVSGNCGYGAIDLEAFREQQPQHYPIHQLELTGHITLRRAVGLQDAYDAASPAQIQCMAGLAERALEQGACGISFGLEYAPGTTPQELQALAKVAARRARNVCIHTRTNCPNDLDSLKEGLDLATQTGARVVISHLVYMFAGEGLHEALEMIDDALVQGADVWVDSGVYTAFATHAGTPLFDERSMRRWRWSFSNIVAATGPWAGQRMTRELCREIREQAPQTLFIYDCGQEEDVAAAHSRPYMMVSTDCGVSPPGQGHPQNSASFPKYLRLFAREGGSLSLPEAVRRCTLLPAQAFGLDRKGRLQPGMDADLVAFDPEGVAERADFPGRGNPDASPQGIAFVFKNGVPTVEQGQLVSAEISVAAPVPRGA